MKHTQFLSIIILFFLIISFSYGQSIDFTQDDGLKTSIEEVSKSNNKLLKELKKLKAKARYELQNECPDLSKEQLDSLIDQRVTEYKEEVRDSAKTYLSKLRKQLSEQIKESPENLPISDELRSSIEQLDELEALQALSADKSALNEMLSAENLKKLDKRAGDLFESFTEYKQYFKDWDKDLLSTVKSLPEAQKIQSEIDKLKAYQPLPDGYREKMTKFQSNDFVKEQLSNKAREFEAVGGDLQEQFDEATAILTEAKKKFPSLQSIEEAPKRYNPYKGQALIQRLKYGGNMNINPQEPWSADVSAYMFYPINLRLSIGVESGGRIFFQERESATNTVQQANNWTLRSFSRYQLTKSIYLQANYEATKIMTALPDKNSEAIWYRTGMVGLGRTFNFKKKLKINTIILYDLFYNPETSPNGNAWIFRMGLGL